MRQRAVGGRQRRPSQKRAGCRRRGAPRSRRGGRRAAPRERLQLVASYCSRAPRARPGRARPTVHVITIPRNRDRSLWRDRGADSPLGKMYYSGSHPANSLRPWHLARCVAEMLTRSSLARRRQLVRNSFCFWSQHGLVSCARVPALPRFCKLPYHENLRRPCENLRRIAAVFRDRFEFESRTQGPTWQMHKSMFSNRVSRVNP